MTIGASVDLVLGIVRGSIEYGKDYPYTTGLEGTSRHETIIGLDILYTVLGFDFELCLGLDKDVTLLNEEILTP